MAITVNTNVTSLMVQNSLTSSTEKMSTAMQRLSTGLRINSAKDDAAGMAVATNMNAQVRGTQIAQSNGQMGDSLLTTTEGVLDVVQSNLLRIRDLTEQAANGTYGDDSRSAIETEVQARVEEIHRIAETADFNGIKLLNGDQTEGINIQVGTGSDEDVNCIELKKELFEKVDVSLISGTIKDEYKTDGKLDLSKVFADDKAARGFLDNIDNAIKNVTERKTLVGAAQNRISSAVDGLKVQETNLTSAQSTIEDADVASESSEYVKQQILQQTAATLLVQANQSPSIAVSLV